MAGLAGARRIDGRSLPQAQLPLFFLSRA